MTSDATVPADSFVISRVFNAPRTRLWDAWTRLDQLGRWFGPKGSTTSVVTQDLRPGGYLHARIQSPDGGTLWTKFDYRELIAPSRLVWVQSFSDENAGMARAPFFDGNWPLEILTTVTFAEEGAGTRVTLTSTPLEANETERQTFVANRDSMNRGWSGSFEELDAVLSEV